VVGIDWTWAYRLMPWIGVMDIGLGLTMAVVPLRVVLLHLTVWGLWTAALRPLSGDVVWEFSHSIAFRGKQRGLIGEGSSGRDVPFIHVTFSQALPL
jgi:hypothetical protein